MGVFVVEYLLRDGTGRMNDLSLIEKIAIVLFFIFLLMLLLDNLRLLGSWLQITFDLKPLFN
jgi:hypothetical protein